MAKINRKYIDKHWLVFLIRGGLAAVLGCFILFGGIRSIENAAILVSVFLLLMGVIDAVSALYNSNQKRGWFTSVIDALVDVIAAVFLLFFTKNILENIVLVLSIYTIVSGLIDIFHGALSTVDPTDRFIRTLAGICGCVMGIVILNAGNFEITTFIRFFGAYEVIVGVTSLIYGVHNRSQNIEDKIARKESARKPAAKKTTAKKTTAKKTTKKKK
ncbi:DUF308 domain-containing protein [Candidatus Saccharibacteria bacterium]|nr:DUF308 domain-containing protein [Candidatus Saccharibacteria bacterium]